MDESKEPTSITDDPAHPITERGDPTVDPAKGRSPNAELEDEERPTTKRPA